MKFYIPSDAICISYFFLKKNSFCKYLDKGHSHSKGQTSNLPVH